MGYMMDICVCDTHAGIEFCVCLICLIMNFDNSAQGGNYFKIYFGGLN